MKLRRAMAVAAATAVIAPVTFLAAPAAFATTPTPTSTETTTTSPSPTDTATSTASPTDTATTSSAPTDAASSPSAPANSPSTPATSPSTTATTPGEDEEPDEDFECEEGSIKVSLGGFPNKIVAGSGWKNFTFNVKNTGKTDIESLFVYTVATYADGLENPNDKLLMKYGHFEYKDPESGEWVNDFADSGFNNGFFFGEFPLDAGKKVTIDLRVKIDKGAPAGQGLAIAAGGYDNGAEDESYKCFENGDMYPFAIVKAGSNPGDVEDSKPNGEKPGSDVKPQGGAKEIPVTGNLAETGSSSVLPTVGIAGGIAIVAGAGVVFAMKRRRSDGATA